jgi:ketosteroid isomerase-like protein
LPHTALFKRKYNMPENKNADLVRAAFEDFNSGNLDALLNRFAENIVWETPFPQDIVPFGGKRAGKEQVREFFVTLAQTTETTHFEPKEFIVADDIVVALGYYEALVRQTGRKGGSDFAMVFRIQNGKIVAFKEFVDTHAVVQAWLPVPALAH